MTEEKKQRLEQNKLWQKTVFEKLNSLEIGEKTELAKEFEYRRFDHVLTIFRNKGIKFSLKKSIFGMTVTRLQ